MRLPSDLQTTAPPKRKKSKPHTLTLIAAYDKDTYTPLRLESNQIYRVTPYYNTLHQKWPLNVHNQVKDTLKLIANCLHENLSRNYQPVTYNDCLSKMTNAITVEDTGVSMEYRPLIKNQNIDQFGSNPPPMR